LSSILKALKKIEEETPPPDIIPSLPHSTYSRQARDSKIRKRRRGRNALILLVLLLATAAAAGFFISRSGIKLATDTHLPAAGPGSGSTAENPRANQIYKAKIAAASQKVSQPQPIAARRTPGPRNNPDSVDSRGGSLQSGKPSDPSKAPPAGALQSKNPAPAFKPPIKRLPKTKTLPTPGKKPTRQGAAPAENQAAPNDEASIPPAATAAAKTPPAPAKVAYERLSDSKMKLQALAWSADVDRRMAVINGRIVREGESVDGYQIMQIREEDVVLREGGRSFRLEFAAQR
jgi:hypothetical protein